MLPRDGFLARLAECIDPEFHDVAGLEELRRLHAEADAGGRAGADDVAGKQGHELADVADEGGHVEDQLIGAAVLAQLAVHSEPHFEGAGIGDFVSGGDERAERRERVATFSLHPLAAAFELKGALGIIVVQGVAGDVLHCVLWRDVGGFLADDYGELHFPVGFFGAARNYEIVVGPTSE